MKKKLIAVLLCTLLVFSFPVTAMAQAQTATASQVMQLEMMVFTANVSIAALVVWAQLTPFNDVPWLLWQVDRIVDHVMDYSNSIGATVECEYIEYTIDGQSVMIDPLRVINVGTGK